MPLSDQDKKTLMIVGGGGAVVVLFVIMSGRRGSNQPDVAPPLYDLSGASGPGSNFPMPGLPSPIHPNPGGEPGPLCMYGRDPITGQCNPGPIGPPIPHPVPGDPGPLCLYGRDPVTGQCNQNIAPPPPIGFPHPGPLWQPPPASDPYTPPIFDTGVGLFADVWGGTTLNPPRIATADNVGPETWNLLAAERSMQVR